MATRVPAPRSRGIQQSRSQVVQPCNTNLPLVRVLRPVVDCVVTDYRRSTSTVIPASRAAGAEAKA
jgi:hypothetical protein